MVTSTDCSSNNNNNNPYTTNDFHHIHSPLEEVKFWNQQRDRHHQTITDTRAFPTKEGDDNEKLETIDQVCSHFQDVIAVFEYLEEHSLVGCEHGHDRVSTVKGRNGVDHDNDNRNEFAEDSVQNQSYHQKLDFLKRSFTDGNCIETVLYKVFEVKDTHGNYIYTSAVSLILYL